MSVTLLAGCAVGTNSQIAAGGANSCMTLRTTMTAGLQSDVQDLKNGSSVLISAVQSAAGDRSVSPDTQQALDDAATAANIADKQLQSVLQLPDTSLPEGIATLQNLIDVAGDAQQKALHQAQAELGASLDAALPAGAQATADLQAKVSALQNKVHGLQVMAGLSADAKTSLAGLAVQLDVLAKELGRHGATDATGLVQVQAALKNANNALLDLQSKAGGALNTDALKGLTLDINAAADSTTNAVPVAPVPQAPDAQVQGTVQGAVNSTVNAVPPVVTPAPAQAPAPAVDLNVNVNAALKSAAPIVPVTQAVPAVVPDVTAGADATVQGILGK